jgi:hypothetical protein
MDSTQTASAAELGPQIVLSDQFASCRTIGSPGEIQGHQRGQLAGISVDAITGPVEGF